MRYAFGVLAAVVAAVFFAYQGFAFYKAGSLTMTGYDVILFGESISIGGAGAVTILFFEATILTARRYFLASGENGLARWAIVLLVGVTVATIITEYESRSMARADKVAERQSTTSERNRLEKEIADAEATRAAWRPRLENAKATRQDLRDLESRIDAMDRRVDSLRGELQKTTAVASGSPIANDLSTYAGGAVALWLAAILGIQILVAASLRVFILEFVAIFFRPASIQKMHIVRVEPRQKPGETVAETVANPAQAVEPVAVIEPEKPVKKPVEIAPPSMETVTQVALEGLRKGEISFSVIEDATAKAFVKAKVTPPGRERLRGILKTLGVRHTRRVAKGALYNNIHGFEEATQALAA